MFLFFKDEEYAATSKEFTPIFREFKGKVIFIYINGSNSEMDNVREFFGIEPEDRLVSMALSRLPMFGFGCEPRTEGEVALQAFVSFRTPQGQQQKAPSQQRLLMPCLPPPTPPRPLSAVP